MFTDILSKRARASDVAPDQILIENIGKDEPDDTPKYAAKPAAKTGKNEEPSPPDKRERAIVEKLVRFAHVPASSIFESVFQFLSLKSFPFPTDRSLVLNPALVLSGYQTKQLVPPYRNMAQISSLRNVV